LESGKDETWLRGWVLERAFGLGEISSGAAEQLRVFGVGKGSRRVAEAQRFGVRRLREEVMRLEVRWLMMLLIFAGLLWLWQIDGEVGDQAQGVELPDSVKLQVVDLWLAASREVDFGLVVGKENPGALDLGRLQDVVKETKMSDEVRSEIGTLLEERED
jgi:hypothetical protein